MAGNDFLAPDKGWLDYLTLLEEAEGFVPFVFQYCGYNYEFVRWMQRHLPPHGAVLEVGTGSGLMSIILASFGHRVTALDIDQKILDQGRAKSELLGVKVDFVRGDMFQLGKKFPPGAFDLAFSYGVVEHYDYEVASRALAAQGQVAKRVLAVVPSRLVKSNLRGDERPYTLSRLVNVVRQAGLHVEDTFAFGLTDPGQRLRAVLPYAVWYHLVRPRFSATLAVLGTTGSRGRRDA